MNVMAIGAHPADVFDLAGGTLANFAQENHDVFVATITHGAFSHTQMIQADGSEQDLRASMKLKKEECDQAGRHIGVKQFRYFECDDEPFIPARKDVLELAEYVREVQPSVVITHHPREYGHPDHPVVGDMALRSLKAAERWLHGSRRKPHIVRRVYFFGTQFRGICEQLGSVPVAPDFIVDVSNSIEKKARALAAFQSQSFKGAQYQESWVKERIEKIEGNWGFVAGLKYAEEFIALTPQLVGLLP